MNFFNILIFKYTQGCCLFKYLQGYLKGKKVIWNFIYFYDLIFLNHKSEFLVFVH